MSLDTELLATMNRLHCLTAVNPIRIELSQANFDALAAAVAPKLVKPSATPFGGSFFGPDRASVGGVRSLTWDAPGNRDPLATVDVRVVQGATPDFWRVVWRCKACHGDAKATLTCKARMGAGEVYEAP